MKRLIFSNGGSIYVDCDCTLQDEENLDENFRITAIRGVNVHSKIKLFYWLVKLLPYTLNELVFFAVNNDLCLYVLDSDGTVLTVYGTCAGSLGDFNWDFNNDFLK